MFVSDQITQATTSGVGKGENPPSPQGENPPVNGFSGTNSPIKKWYTDGAEK